MAADGSFVGEGSNARAIADWLKEFRFKKMLMRRKLRGAPNELRIAAILSTAVSSTEVLLRRKQQERLNRWLEMQSQLKMQKQEEEEVACRAANCEIPAEATVWAAPIPLPESTPTPTSAPLPPLPKAPAKNEQDIVKELWSTELRSLDEFMKSICSSSNNNSSSSVYSSVSSSSSNMSSVSVNKLASSEVSCGAHMTRRARKRDRYTTTMDTAKRRRLLCSEA